MNWGVTIKGGRRFKSDEKQGFEGPIYRLCKVASCSARLQAGTAFYQVVRPPVPA